MDKFERVEQYCTNGELAIKSEGMEDTFKDIAVYSTLAMILYRKMLNEQHAKEVLSENGYKDWEDEGKPPLYEDKHGNVHTKEWTDKEIALQDLDNRGSLFDDNVMEKLEAQRQGHLRSKENVSHFQSIQRDANNN